MFDEMVERIQRNTISVLLKVRIEIRSNGAPVRPAQNAAQNSAQSAAPQNGERRVFRRQMPVPIQNMSSYKEAQQKAQAAAGDSAGDKKN